MGNLTCAIVRESAYDACSESSPKQKEAEYGDRATCVVHTWRVSSFMFPKGVWRCLRTDVDVMGHATSFFRVWRWLCGKTKRGRMKKNDAMQECERHRERGG